MRSIILIVLFLLAGAAHADAPRDAQRMAPETALSCVAERYRGEALRIRAREDGLLQELRWRTPLGNVLRIEVTGPGCRFIRVDGVGQTEARILPQAAR